MINLVKQASGTTLDISERYQRMRQERQREIEHEIRQRRSGTVIVPARFKKASLENFQVDSPQQAFVCDILRCYVGSFQERLQEGSAIILSGAPYTGKTHLGIATLLAIHTRGFSCRYVTGRDYLRKIKGSYTKGGDKTEVEILKQFLSPALLMIDQIEYGHSSRGILTTAERNAIFELIDRRYAENKCVIVATNKNISDLKLILGEGTLSRLQRDGVVLGCDWAPYSSLRKRATRKRDSRTHLRVVNL